MKGRCLLFMLYIDALKPMKLYRNDFIFPIDKKDIKKHSIVYLMTPDIESSKRLLMTGDNTLINSKNYTTLFQSYFLEKNVELYIKPTKKQNIFVNESSYEYDYDILKYFNAIDECKDIEYNSPILSVDDTRVLLAEDVDHLLNTSDTLLLKEDKFVSRFGTYNLPTIFRKILYDERIKNQKEVLNIYDNIKKLTKIKYTFVNPELYKEKNLIYDWSYYTDIFFKNNKFTSDKGLDIFYNFLNRFLGDSRFSTYTKKTILIPLHDWGNLNTDILDYQKNINPVSMIYRHLRTNPHLYSIWKDYKIILLGDKSYMILDMTELIDKPDYVKFGNLVRKIISNNVDDVESIKIDSKESIMVDLVDKVSNSIGIDITNISGGTDHLSQEELLNKGLVKNAIYSDDNEVKKAALVNQLEKIADNSLNTKEALKKLDKNSIDDEDYVLTKDILVDLQSTEGVKMNKARADRMDKSRKELLNKEINGRSIISLLQGFSKDIQLKEEPINIDSLDDSWKHMKFNTFNKEYNERAMNEDIVAVFNHFNNVTHPMNIRGINYENTSTSEDYINTWTCLYEDAETGKRFTMKLDLPIIIGDRFMKLRGNEKLLLGQLMLLPVIKTDDDTVQMVSNYNKIFLRRKSPAGLTKSTAIVNRLCKVISKYTGRDIKFKPGDNRKICSKYDLPIDYIDLASLYSTIEFKDNSYISFNMSTLANIPFDRNTIPKEDIKLSEEELNKKYLAIYVNSSGKKEPIINMGTDRYILEKISNYDTSGKFVELFNSTKAAKRLVYSAASILSIEIPIIILLAYNIGLTKVLSKANIKFEFSDTRPGNDKDYIKFNDGYLIYYPKNEADDMLVNGIMQIETSQFSYTEIDGKDIWLNVLDDYGGRIKADGLDNFYDLMMDPITKEICKLIGIPSDYVEAMLYGNNLLVDNKYNKHSDITGNRLRTNEIIVAHLYKVLATSYGIYRNMRKRNNSMSSFTAKQSAVIDSLLTHDQTSSDLSTLTPLLEAESANKVTFKGLSGMNSERAFSMDKRTYDDSMLGVLGISTGFASTVGINRQLTMDASIKSKRGFIVPKKADDLNTVNSQTVMEGLSPMAINHDDPFRTAMAYIQTSQHQMTVRKSMPMLVTSGTDEALPYLTSNKFSYKFKGRFGTIVEVTDDHIIVRDDDLAKVPGVNPYDFIDLRETIRKNSDGGFYITTKLSTNENIVKKGAKIKHNDILAYDKANYSSAIGNNNFKYNPNGLSYNLGTISKVAIMNTDLGFEDSCVVDTHVSKALTSDICIQKEINLDKNSNVYNLVKVGDSINANDPLLVFQEAFEDKEANDLLRAISLNQDEISDIGRKHIRSKVSGKIQDIKIYRTCEIDELSPTLKKIVQDYEAKINKIKNIMSKYKIDKQYTLEPTRKLPQEGKLKDLDGIRIEIFVKTDDIFACGDKLVFYQALKGVCSYIIPEGDEAVSDYRPNEYVSSFLTINGVMGRMVPSALNLGMIFKLIIELTRQCQEELGIKWRPMQDILTDIKPTR